MAQRKNSKTGNVKAAGKSSFNWVNIKKVCFRWIKFLIVGFFGLSILSAILFRFIPIPVTPLMLIRCTEQLMDETKPLKLHKDWVSLDQISGNAQLAVICAEDQKYLDHFGFDIEAIKEVLNKKEQKKKIRGASTISQQTAKNVFLWPGRSWIRKGLEVYFTLLIETFWSKERILEVYLNIAEMGEGVYGIQAAGKEYFKKDAKNLNKSEAALIASVLPNPRKYSVKKPSSYIRGRQKWIMRQMGYWGNNFDVNKAKTPSQQKTTRKRK